MSNIQDYVHNKLSNALQTAILTQNKDAVREVLEVAKSAYHDEGELTSSQYAELVHDAHEAGYDV